MKAIFRKCFAKNLSTALSSFIASPLRLDSDQRYRKLKVSVVLDTLEREQCERLLRGLVSSVIPKESLLPSCVPVSYVKLLIVRLSHRTCTIRSFGTILFPLPRQPFAIPYYFLLDKNGFPVTLRLPTSRLIISPTWNVMTSNR